MHFRRFPITSIPISDPDEFENWIRQRWLEKDDLLEYYMQNGRFPEDDDQTNGQPTAGKAKTGVNQRIKVGGKERTISTTGGSSAAGTWGGPIETEVKLKAWWEALDIFVVLLCVPFFPSFFAIACCLPSHEVIQNQHGRDSWLPWKLILILHSRTAVLLANVVTKAYAVIRVAASVSGVQNV